MAKYIVTIVCDDCIENTDDLLNVLHGIDDGQIEGSVKIDVANEL